jgi:hypothetical protein
VGEISLKLVLGSLMERLVRPGFWQKVQLQRVPLRGLLAVGVGMVTWYLILLRSVLVFDVSAFYTYGIFFFFGFRSRSLTRNGSLQ